MLVLVVARGGGEGGHLVVQNPGSLVADRKYITKAEYDLCCLHKLTGAPYYILHSQDCELCISPSIAKGSKELASSSPS